MLIGLNFLKSVQKYTISDDAPPFLMTSCFGSDFIGCGPFSSSESAYFIRQCADGVVSFQIFICSRFKISQLVFNVNKYSFQKMFLKVFSM